MEIGVGFMIDPAVIELALGVLAFIVVLMSIGAVAAWIVDSLFGLTNGHDRDMIDELGKGKR